MKKETETESDKRSGLEGYWERMKLRGRETALSEINAKKIAGYKERLRDQALSTTEVVGIQIIGKLENIEKRWEEEKPSSSRKAIFNPRPPLVGGFVGRNDILEAMRTTHFETTSTRHNAPRVTVLTGLGGSGKTQIALKFASEFEEKYTDGSVYFLDASSQATLETDLKSLVTSQSDPGLDTLVWLASTKGCWLIIMDNADDPSLDLVKFIPRCSHGHIIITTRNHLRKILAPKSTHPVDSLPLDDSITLLLETSGYEDNEVNRQHSEKIAQELGCLPLALAHAGAYILLRQCLDTYLKTYRDSRSQLLGRKVDLLHDYPHSVATTIEMSFKRLSPRSQDLLGLLCHLDARSIPRGLIEQAAGRRFLHVAMETELSLRTETTEYAEILTSILCPQGDWSSFEFDSLIEECEQYSLVQFVTQYGEKFYSMHVLVQGFLQAARSVVRGHPSSRLVARLLGSTVTIGGRWEYLAFNRSLLAHLRLVSLDDMTEPGDHYGFGYVLEEVGEGRLAVSHMEHCLELWRESFGEESELLLDAMEMLARSYSTAGKEENALGIRERVMKSRREVWGEDHLDTLHAVNNLAVSYSRLGRDKGALTLREEVVEKYRRLLGDNHLDTLQAINNLAVSYLKLGRDKEALPLFEEVVEKRRRLLGGNHLDTLHAISNLAVSYSNLGRDEEALALKEEVVEKYRRLLGDNHLDTLQSISNLAISYSKLGRDKEALPLREGVVEKRRRLLGDNHLDTLQAIHNLAISYSTLGRAKEAMPLVEDVVNQWTVLLGEDHHSTLNAMKTLANIYIALGQHEDALKL
ncbi:TPR-like protein [Serendipita vermifera]|nr:TPR-like protein [Serendipita vermifera]